MGEGEEVHEICIPRKFVYTSSYIDTIFLFIFSPAHLAAAAGHTETVTTLLRNGVSVDLLRSSDSRSLLHLAASNGHTSCLHKLLQEGASVVIKDNTKER